MNTINPTQKESNIRVYENKGNTFLKILAFSAFSFHMRLISLLVIYSAKYALYISINKTVVKLNVHK